VACLLDFVVVVLHIFVVRLIVLAVAEHIVVGEVMVVVVVVGWMEDSRRQKT